MSRTEINLRQGPPRPEPRPIRSWQDAEHNAAAWMRYWGFRDAVATPGGADGGVDVRAADAFGQVKYQAVQVGRPDLQRLFGARGRETDKQLIFFTGSDYASTAVAYAEEMEIALFVYGLDGSMTAVNSAARRISTVHAARLPAASPRPTAVAQGKGGPGPLNWRLLVGLLFLILPISHALHGALETPLEAVLDFLGFWTAGLLLVWWWMVKRSKAGVLRLADEPPMRISEARPTGPSSSAATEFDNSSLVGEVVHQLQRGNKIQAVKLYREATGVGLSEAKGAVEEIAGQQGL